MEIGGKSHLGRQVRAIDFGAIAHLYPLTNEAVQFSKHPGLHTVSMA